MNFIVRTADAGCQPWKDRYPRPARTAPIPRRGAAVGCERGAPCGVAEVLRALPPTPRRARRRRARISLQCRDGVRGAAAGLRPGRDAGGFEGGSRELRERGDRIVRSPPLPHPTIYSYVGDGASTLIRRALPPEKAGLLPKVLDRFLGYYRRHLLDTTRAYPGVVGALRKWAGIYRMAVLTNKGVAMTREILSGLSLDGYFFEVRGGDSFGTKKPDPEGLLHILRKAGVEAREAVMIGDSRNDVLGGKGGRHRHLRRHLRPWSHRVRRTPSRLHRRPLPRPVPPDPSGGMREGA